MTVTVCCVSPKLRRLSTTCDYVGLMAEARALIKHAVMHPREREKEARGDHDGA